MIPHTIKTMALSDLKPAPYNPREISEEALNGLTKSIQEFGLVQPLVLNQRTGHLIGGHQRVVALQRAGETEAEVIVVDLDEGREKALNVALNNPHVAGEFTDHLQVLLASLKTELPDLFTELALDKLIKSLPNLNDADPDEAPAPPAEAITKPGDVWVLGDHLLVCGDCTTAGTIDAVLGGSQAKMIFTDPPWNVAIGQDSNPRHRQRDGLQNDDLGEDFGAFLDKWAATCLPRLEGDLYCVMGSREWPRIDTSLREAGMHWSGVLVWVKDSFVLGRSQYHRRFEPIWYGWPEKNGSSYDGGRDQDDVWEFARPKRSEEHPTMKPVDLIIKAIQNSSKPGDIVLDTFAGAGSTLIACEKTGRAGRGIEISPVYCDVIVKRWEKFTGKKAELRRG